MRPDARRPRISRTSAHSSSDIQAGSGWLSDQRVQEDGGVEREQHTGRDPRAARDELPAASSSTPQASDLRAI
jgi:hypothetical protein